MNQKIGNKTLNAGYDIWKNGVLARMHSFAHNNIPTILQWILNAVYPEI